jgi:hypothetical protein
MTFSEAEWEVLTSAMEDFYGLWEVSGGIRSPSVNVDGHSVRNAIRSLLEKKLIYLSWFNHETNEEEPIVETGTDQLLADPSVWEPPESKSRYLAFTATPAGESACRTSKPPVRQSVG